MIKTRIIAVLLTLTSAAISCTKIDSTAIYLNDNPDGGQIVQLDRNTLEISTETALDDARGVDTDGQQVGVVAGTGGLQIIKIEDNTATVDEDDKVNEGLTL